MIDVGAHDFCATRPPCPDRGRDIFHNGNCRISGTHAPSNAARKAGAVDDDEQVRASCDHFPCGKSHQPQNFRKAAGNGAEADDGQIVDRIEARDTFLCHLASANAGKPQFRAAALFERAHECPAELIARLLSRHEEKIEQFRPGATVYSPRHCSTGFPHTNDE